MRLRPVLFGLCVLSIAGLLCASWWRVAQLERRELEHVTDWASIGERLQAPGSTRISARLTEVELKAGQRALFELCAQEDLGAPHWLDAMDFVVWRPSVGLRELKVRLDKAHLAHVGRSSQGSCLQLGGGDIEHTGHYAVEAVYADRPPSKKILAAPLRIRVLARTPLSRREGTLVFGIALAGLLAVLTGFVARPVASVSVRGSFAWAAAGFATALLLGVAVLSVPLGGAVGGLSRGLALAVIEIGVALAFALRLGKPRDQLALYAPSARGAVAVLAALVCAVTLNQLARFAMRIVPSTGEAPIEAFISWPSGALAFAALGMVVPLAEELFFRGFVYGALEHRGRLFAFVVTFLGFAAVHVQQAWGNWGALIAVTLTGAVLTGLRAVSGSTLVPIVAHLLYNLSLWARSFG